MPALGRQHATLRFYSELNDFLPHQQRFLPLCHCFALPASVKDVFESIGIPHPEVELILINGIPAGFGHLVHDGDRVSIYPAFRTLDLSPIPPLRPRLRVYRFVLDAHLGRLATCLRVLGFDAAYKRNGEDKELARISHEQERILLTRDRGLLKRSEVVYGYFVRSTEVKRQVTDVLWRFDLFAAAAPFQRCLRCNVLLAAATKQSILARLPPKTRLYYDEFRICSACRRIYWAGSHYERLNRFVQEVLARTES
jgi:uncharacterized protein with PIN domain